MNTFAFWENHRLVPDEICLWQCGVFSLYLEHSGIDLLVAPHQHPDNPIPAKAGSIFQSVEPKQLPKNLNWKRWAINAHEPVNIHLRPFVPEKPLLVYARRPFLLPPGEQTLFYIYIPLCFRLFFQHAAPKWEKISLSINSMKM